MVIFISFGAFTLRNTLPFDYEVGLPLSTNLILGFLRAQPAEVETKKAYQHKKRDAAKPPIYSMVRTVQKSAPKITYATARN